MAILDFEREQYQVRWAKSGIKLKQYKNIIILILTFNQVPLVNIIPKKS